MDLNGTWYNELGSKMELQENEKTITGKYITAVGGGQGEYDLVGRTDTDYDKSKNVGFVVSWENEHGSCDSVTSWSGQMQIINGEEVITTTWLLTKESEPFSNWKDTLVDKDIFTRKKPSDTDIQEKMNYKRVSHPINPRLN